MHQSFPLSTRLSSLHAQLYCKAQRRTETKGVWLKSSGTTIWLRNHMSRSSYLTCQPLLGLQMFLSRCISDFKVIMGLQSSKPMLAYLQITTRDCNQFQNILEALWWFSLFTGKTQNRPTNPWPNDLKTKELENSRSNNVICCYCSKKNKIVWGQKLLYTSVSHSLVAQKQKAFSCLQIRYIVSKSKKWINFVLCKTW